MTIYDEQRRQLSALLHGALPAGRAAHLESLIRDTIAITTRKAKKSDAALGASRLGGSPDLPEGAGWPVKENGGVAFVGQLRLEDLAPLDVHQRLPKQGLLSFFHGFLTNGEYEAEGRVFYFPEAPRGLATLHPPNRRGRPTPVGIDFAPLALLPPYASPLVPYEANDPYVELFDAQYAIAEGDFSFHGLFGFDRPREGNQQPGEELLLRLDAGGVPYDFVEAACAYYFVPQGDLGRGDFSKARLYEGASI